MLDREILVVDDEKDLRTMIRSIFESAGYTQITTAASGQEALAVMAKKIPGIIILDVMMPDMDGFELLQEIRAVSKVPVLMLTAKGEAEDRFAGFELGADDYLVKPFLPKELLLRVQAILKRAYPEKERVVTLNAASVDLDRAEVIRDGQRTPLTAKEYSIWQGYETTLMTHIRHLREKIEENPSKPVSLLTVKGLGYKLVVKEPEK